MIEDVFPGTGDCICEWPETCGTGVPGTGLGTIECLGCGGDQCICACGGEDACGGCPDCAPDEPEGCEESDGF